MTRSTLACSVAGRLSAALTIAALGACASSPPPPPKPKSPSGERETAITHEDCDRESAAANKVDVNGDGIPDITHVVKEGREVCRVIDLNLDGASDAYIYYDAQGAERRRESDFDRDGRPDEIAHYERGAVVLKERETNFDGKLDTWDHYEGGRLVRRERDSDGDAIIDQWWQFNNVQNPKCAVVATDQNADGKPDPGGVVDLCGESYGAPKPPSTPPAATATSNELAEPGATAAGAAPPASAAPPPSAQSKPAEKKGP